MRTTLFTVLIIISAVCPAHVGAETDAPPSRNIPELARIGTFSPFFDLGQGAVRIVAIVSPESPEAEAVFDAIARVFAEVSNNRLRAFIVLSPESPRELQADALRLFARVEDRRITGFWDPKGVTRDHWQPAVESESRGWDAVFVYDTDVRFSATTDEGSYWFYNPDSGKASVLEASPLEIRVRELLASFERRTRTSDSTLGTP